MSQELVEYIAKALVDDQESVSVREASDDDDRRVIELRVSEEDRGKVIGRKGRTAHAIRTLLNAASDSGDVVLEAEAGLTFCLITNRAQATAASLPQRLAIIEVLSVTTSQVRLALSTFRIED